MIIKRTLFNETQAKGDEEYAVTITTPAAAKYNVGYISIRNTRPFEATAKIELSGAVMPPSNRIDGCALHIDGQVFDGLKMGVQAIEHYARGNETTWRIALIGGEVTE